MDVASSNKKKKRKKKNKRKKHWTDLNEVTFKDEGKSALTHHINTKNIVLPKNTLNMSEKNILHQRKKKKKKLKKMEREDILRRKGDENQTFSSPCEHVNNHDGVYVYDTNEIRKKKRFNVELKECVYSEPLPEVYETTHIDRAGSINHLHDKSLNRNSTSNESMESKLNINGGNSKCVSRKRSKDGNKHSDNVEGMNHDKLLNRSSTSNEYMESDLNTGGNSKCISRKRSKDGDQHKKHKKKKKKTGNIVYQNTVTPNSTESNQDIKKVIVLDDCDPQNGKAVNNFKNTTNEAVHSDQKCDTKEPQEDWSSPLHHVRCGRNYQDKMKILKEKGIVPRKGRWAPDDIKQLEHNMNEFLSMHDVKDYAGLIEIKSKEDSIFRRKTQFVLKMCRGIQRTGIDIATKILTYFPDYYQKGALSRNEQKDLIKFRLHGIRWKEIGMLMNRGPMDISRAHDRLSKAWKKGPWSVQEDEALTKAVKGYINRGEKISWKQVSTAVGTRHSTGCHSRWFILSNKHIGLDQKEIYELVSLIHESNVDDEYFIDWNNLSRHFNNKVSTNWLKWKFGAICKEVPHSHKLEFGELVEQVYEIYQGKVDCSENCYSDINDGGMLNDENISLGENENILSSHGTSNRL